MRFTEAVPSHCIGRKFAAQATYFRRDWIGGHTNELYEAPRCDFSAFVRHITDARAVLY